MIINEHLGIIVALFFSAVFITGISLTLFLIINRKDFKDKTSFWEIFLIKELLFEPERYVKPEKIAKYKKLRKILIYLTILYVVIFSFLVFIIEKQK